MSFRLPKFSVLFSKLQRRERFNIVSLEFYFQKFRKNIVGIDHSFESPFGKQKIVYTDWTASGRLYEPIERKMLESFGPFVGNTHSESTATGGLMTHAYHHAHSII